MAEKKTVELWFNKDLMVVISGQKGEPNIALEFCKGNYVQDMERLVKGEIKSIPADARFVFTHPQQITKVIEILAIMIKKMCEKDYLIEEGIKSTLEPIYSSDNDPLFNDSNEPDKDDTIH